MKVKSKLRIKNSHVTVGIVCSAPIDYQICCDALRLSDEVELVGRHISTGGDKENTIIAVHAGPGKILSASATQLIIDRFKPDIIIDVGGAGALSQTVTIFDIVIAEYAYEYDICLIKDFHRLANDLTTRTILCDLSNEGKNILIQFMTKIKNEKKVGCEIGNIASGERNVNNRILRKELFNAFNATACNWETSAILKTAQLNNIRAISFCVITDNANEEMFKEYTNNSEKALSILYPILEEFIYGGWLLGILDCINSGKEETK